MLSFISAIWSFTEFFLFLSRLYERIAPDATLKIVVTLRGCKGRELASLDGRVVFFGGYIAEEDTIRQEREVQVADLRASHLTIASGMVKHMFHIFGWLDVSDETVAHWQQRLLKREL